jgi:hypothetical protein
MMEIALTAFGQFLTRRPPVGLHVRDLCRVVFASQTDPAALYQDTSEQSGAWHPGNSGVLCYGGARSPETSDVQKFRYIKRISQARRLAPCPQSLRVAQLTRA